MSVSNKPPRGVAPLNFVDEEWLALRSEPVLDPELPIIDAHHHLWERPNSVYMLPQLLTDITSSGHNIRASVFVECAAMYRIDGDPRFACVGQIEFANGVAAVCASGIYGGLRACAGIVGNVDLTDSAAAEILDACVSRAPERLRGIRHIAAWDHSPQVNNFPRPPPPHLLEDPRFRRGFSQLAPRCLSFDAWVFHPQLPEVVALADEFPNTSIILNHMGGRTAVGPYAARHDAFEDWRAHIQELGQRPNVTIKIGGIGMRLGGFDFHDRPAPPTSGELAAAWQRTFDVCMSAFGPSRAMFESNFPVDKTMSTYRVTWNTFKRLTTAFSPAEKADLFAGSAARVYRLPPALALSSKAVPE
jgi:L-fuconolactonase